ncbi:MAG: tetratricopeptide repeat protein [Thermoanaerobaculia bacterium]|nr:tetratricopeptide repeat protein [Thermoanaerobaculia bacterium]
MKTLIPLIAAISLSGLFSPFLRPSNTRQLSEKGIESWQAEEFEEAAAAFEQARELRTSAESTFDAGTAMVAAGSHERGEQILRSLAADDELSASSWYNTGNSQLARGALDQAIDSYVEALRASPSNMSAKRNLEIALRRKQEQQQRSGEAQGEQETPDPGQDPSSEDQSGSEELDPDLEQVLRSIEQQEREELSRMRRANAVRRPTDW